VPASAVFGSRLRQSIKVEIGADMSRLIILHDFDRWPKLPIVKGIEGFRIMRAA
jgi:hypothetical protein